MPLNKRERELLASALVRAQAYAHTEPQELYPSDSPNIAYAKVAGALQAITADLVWWIQYLQNEMED